MKKNLLFLILSVALACNVYSQNRVSNTRKNVQSVQPASQNRLNTVMNNMKITPMPWAIKRIQYAKALHTNLQGAKVMDNKTNIGGSKNGVGKLVSSTENGGVVAAIMNEPTVTKSFGNGPRTSFRLVTNHNGWADNPIIAPHVLSKVPQPPQGDGFNCTSVTQTYSAQSTSFMNASVNQKGTSLIPGTIYAYEDYARGNFKEFSADRNPVVVYTTSTTTTSPSNSAMVQNPNGQTLSQGVANIIERFTPAQGTAGANEQIIYSENQSDLSLLVSAGGAYSAYSGFGITKQNSSEHYIYVTYDGIKPLFTIIAQRPENGYFLPGKKPSTSSPLLVVQNVTYGTRILANIDIRTKSNTNYDSLHLQYTSGPNNGKLDFSALANDQTVSFTGNIMVVGTTINIPIVSMKNFEQQISDMFAQGNYKTAAPIIYQLTDLDGNVFGIESITDQFTYPECAPKNDVYSLTSALATIRTGDDGKNSESEFWLELYTGTATNNQKIGTFYDNHTSIEKSFSPTLNLALNGQYTINDFMGGGALLLRLKSHAHTGGDDWDISGLTLTLTFTTQGGINVVKTVTLNGFRFNDRANPVFYFDAGYKLIGN